MMIFLNKELMTLFYNLNANIRFLRKKHSYTQAKLAELLGIKLQSFKNFESGSVNTSLEVLDKLHDLFNVSLDDLVYKDLSSSEE